MGIAILAFLFLGGCSDQDEIDEESVAILRQVPVGTPFNDLPGAMQRLGFSCTRDQRQFADPKGNVRDAEAHLSCERQQRFWLACTKRTRAILLQFNGRLSNVLVNVGRFCG